MLCNGLCVLQFGEIAHKRVNYCRTTADAAQPELSSALRSAQSSGIEARILLHFIVFAFLLKSTNIGHKDTATKSG